MADETVKWLINQSSEGKSTKEHQNEYETTTQPQRDKGLFIILNILNRPYSKRIVVECEKEVV
jgi:hypothetical protein